MYYGFGSSPGPGKERVLMTDGPFTESAETPVAGRYRIGGLIGRGATASVFRAHDESLGRDVALKLFPVHVAGSGELRRNRAEIRLLATFNHPTLVTLYDAGTDTRVPEEPRTFLTMELIDGTDLHARIRNGKPLPASDVARIGAELASALDYVHARGVIHRDIKPGNILLSDDAGPSLPGAKLADFGIARIIEGTRLTATGTTIGTAAYLSPEQATGSALGPATDIYSLGLVLLECLTGTLEYPGSAVESAVARLHRPPRVPPALGSQWARLLSAMTAMEPSGRPTAGDVEAVLRQLSASGTPKPTSGGSTLVLPKLPAQPPRTGSPAARTRVLIPTLPGADEEAIGTVKPTVRVVGGRRPWPWAWRRRLWVAGAGLVLAVLTVVAVVVSVGISQAPSGAPGPTSYPSVPGPLGQHLDQLEKSVSP
jgi:serine/threonine protein kinase